MTQGRQTDGEGDMAAACWLTAEGVGDDYPCLLCCEVGRVYKPKAVPVETVVFWRNESAKMPIG